MIEISKEHKIAGKLEAIEKAVTPIIQQLNKNGLPLDIGVVEKIRNQYLEEQKACAEKLFSLAGFKFDLGDHGWMLIRFSGTEPIIRVYTETTSQSQVQAILDDGLRIADLK